VGLGIRGIVGAHYQEKEKGIGGKKKNFHKSRGERSTPNKNQIGTILKRGAQAALKKTPRGHRGTEEPQPNHQKKSQKKTKKARGRKKGKSPKKEKDPLVEKYQVRNADGKRNIKRETWENTIVRGRKEHQGKNSLVQKSEQDGCGAHKDDSIIQYRK